ncbi:Rv3654c family TadE-like protein [Nocardioides sp.]|uniref:Rv3654c family TadE-like protein n=1 Tax=Nocardioides sp. TaxID=35761 RepID=UPI0039E5622E
MTRETLINGAVASVVRRVRWQRPLRSDLVGRAGWAPVERPRCGQRAASRRAAGGTDQCLPRPRAPSRRRAGRERGSAVPFAIAMIGLLLMIGNALGVVAAMFAAHRTAQAAADLAALAGARAAVTGGDACAESARIAAANGVRIDACSLTGDDVLVTVTAPGPHWFGAHADLQAQARAGPAP